MKRKPNGYWTKSVCSKHAKLYNYRSDFNKFDKVAYTIAYNNGWLDEICSHMKPKASAKNRYIYAYEFADIKTVYVGLTWNINQRHKSHTHKGTLYNFCKDNSKELPNPKILGYYPMLEASEKEAYFENMYTKNGWITLNKMICGGLGGLNNWKKYTYDYIYNISKNYSTIKEFNQHHPNLYTAAHRYGIIDKISSHMVLLNGFLTKEVCLEKAKQYNSISELQKNNMSIYNKCSKMGWLNELHNIIGLKRKPKGYWNKNNCKKEALQYNTRSELKKCNNTVYKICCKNGWLDEVCVHM
jgi:hypothetical protein